jgi:hypothetical protein
MAARPKMSCLYSIATEQQKYYDMNKLKLFTVNTLIPFATGAAAGLLVAYVIEYLVHS